MVPISLSVLCHELWDTTSYRLPRHASPPPLDSFESVVQDTECYESRHGKGDVSPLDNELFGFLVLYT